MEENTSIVVIGLGEVGEVFARALMGRADVSLQVASRATPRSEAAASRLGLELATDLRDALAGAELVLLTVPATSLLGVMHTISAVLAPQTIVADLTSAEPEDVRAAAMLHPGGSGRFVDGTIMGAVSMQGASTPILASGALATTFAFEMARLGFSVRAMPDSQPGDASRVKLMRSIFAKGLEGLMIEAALAARAAGLDAELIMQFDNADKMPLRDHMAMYLRTHPQHAQRRLTEMEASERQLLATGVPSITTQAAIQRYRRTVAQIEAGAVDPATIRDHSAAIDALLAAERATSPDATAAGRQ